MADNEWWKTNMSGAIIWLSTMYSLHSSIETAGEGQQEMEFQIHTQNCTCSHSWQKAVKLTFNSVKGIKSSKSAFVKELTQSGRHSSRSLDTDHFAPAYVALVWLSAIYYADQTHIVNNSVQLVPHDAQLMSQKIQMQKHMLAQQTQQLHQKGVVNQQWAQESAALRLQLASVQDKLEDSEAARKKAMVTTSGLQATIDSLTQLQDSHNSAQARKERKERRDEANPAAIN
jgi:hypothetical protein